MGFSCAGGRRYYFLLIALSASFLLISLLFSREAEQTKTQVRYGKNVSATVRETVDALVRGDLPKLDVPEAELKVRKAYAKERFGGWETDRGRMYLAMGPPDAIESSQSREVWTYRVLNFVVTFVDLPQDSTNRPPGIPSALWIPLSQHSGIALRDIKPPMAHGIIMAEVDGDWLRVSLDASESEIMPLQRR